MSSPADVQVASFVTVVSARECPSAGIVCFSTAPHLEHFLSCDPAAVQVAAAVCVNPPKLCAQATFTFTVVLGVPTTLSPFFSCTLALTLAAPRVAAVKVALKYPPERGVGHGVFSPFLGGNEKVPRKLPGSNGDIAVPPTSQFPLTKFIPPLYESAIEPDVTSSELT